MANYKKLFLNHLDAKGIKYDDRDEFHVVISYSGDNIRSIRIHVSFDKDGEGMVQLYAWDIGNFSGDKLAKGLITCNELNAKYRWVKFYLDKDKDVCVSLDAYIDEHTVGEECLNLVRRMVNISDEAYPLFMKALWA